VRRGGGDEGSDWELIATVTEKLKDATRKALKDVHEKVEKQEDEHLYHTPGWSRELCCSPAPLFASK
jgi:hypothetical protein